MPRMQGQVWPGEGPVADGDARAPRTRQEATVGQGPTGPTVPVLEKEEAPLVTKVGTRGRVGRAALGPHVPGAGRVVVATAPRGGPPHLVRAHDHGRMAPKIRRCYWGTVDGCTLVVRPSTATKKQDVSWAWRRFYPLPYLSISNQPIRAATREQAAARARTMAACSSLLRTSVVTCIAPSVSLYPPELAGLKMGRILAL